MRIAAIYDIHGNLPALEAVMAEIEPLDVDLLVVGGDVVAGPLPSETLALLRQTKIETAFVWGNAEAELLRCVAGKPIGGLSERANDEACWLAETLSSEEIDFIASWSNTFSVETADLGRILFCHATPSSNIQVFTADTPAEMVGPIFAEVDADLVICGHTHRSFDMQIGGVRVVNAGSVGMPFASSGADWLLLDTAVLPQHTDYDLDRAADGEDNTFPPANASACGYPEARIRTAARSKS